MINKVKKENNHSDSTPKIIMILSENIYSIFRLRFRIYSYSSTKCLLEC